MRNLIALFVSLALVSAAWAQEFIVDAPVSTTIVTATTGNFGTVSGTHYGNGSNLTNLNWYGLTSVPAVLQNISNSTGSVTATTFTASGAIAGGSYTGGAISGTTGYFSSATPLSIGRSGVNGGINSNNDAVTRQLFFQVGGTTYARLNPSGLSILGGGAGTTVSGAEIFGMVSATAANLSGQVSATSLYVSGSLTAGVVSRTTPTSTTTIDWNVARDFRLTITSTTALTFTNPPPSGQREWVALTLVQNSPSIAVTLPSARWPYGISPSITTSSTGNVSHVILCNTSDGGASLNCFYPGPNMQ